MPTPKIPLSRRAFGGAAVGAAATGALGTTAGTAQAAGTAQPAERPFRAALGRHSRRPNILFILGDDLGWADLSSYGSPHIRTPNLDRLARQGVRFTNAYSGSATCSPTRFSLYTGLPHSPPGMGVPPSPAVRRAGSPSRSPTSPSGWSPPTPRSPPGCASPATPPPSSASGTAATSRTTPPPARAGTSSSATSAAPWSTTPSSASAASTTSTRATRSTRTCATTPGS